MPSNNINKNNSESLLNVNVNKNNKIDLFIDKKVDLLNLGDSNDNYNNYVLTLFLIQILTNLQQTKIKIYSIINH